ncbi:diguanylate cyclase (GGDEF) domain-containing protein [Thermodesulfobium acidiphilum]|uniref:diguanylate cyclase n=1 Tax=Thermodesulfobium acidiphilum TaxID=1794699 RepID=A0A2R4W0R0_THEAF|nr:sensor domain-containing diguanylate cyclase [Thermodesulfobium acidiphilum]AWB10280.1 diguanylate cyclase (GGDEF) domain-containing protein [Thermodesulfobium acidiphilum]
MDPDDVEQLSFNTFSYFTNNVLLNEEKLKILLFNILENFEDAIVIYDNNLRCIFYNSKYLNILNLNSKEINFFNHTLKEANNLLSKKVINPTVFLNRNSEILDLSRETSDIIELTNDTILERHSIPFSGSPDFKGKIIIYKDITKKIQENISASLDQEIITTVIQNLPFYLLIVDRNKNIIFANQQAKNFDNLSSTCYKLLFGRENPCENCQLEIVVSQKINYAFETNFKNNKTFSVIISNLKSSLDNDLVSIFAMDISKHKEVESKNLYLSYIDPLTGILNRRGFFVFIKSNYERVKLNNKKLFLFFFDIDGLKKINDSYGHINGDIAIKNIAKILKSALRDSDLLARFGGDEFVALVVCNSQSNTDQILNRISKKIHDLNSSKILNFNLSVSCGISEVKPDQLQEIDKIIHKADQAMYLEKKQKKKL